MAEPQAVPAARRAIDELDLVLGPSASRTVELLVSELVKNAIQHGSGRPADTIALRVLTHDGSVRVEVADQGAGFEPPAAGRKGELRTNRWGLYLVECLADRWGVAGRPGRRVWFELSP